VIGVVREMPLLTSTSRIAVASCSSPKRSEHEIGVAVVIDVAGPTLNSSFRLSLEAVSTERGLSRLPVVAQSGGPGMSALAPLLGAKRSSGQPTENDATDPTQTLAAGCVEQLRLFLRVPVAGVLC